jgi:hypothetical protein
MKGLKGLAVALCMLTSSALLADDTSPIQIHGFGGWSYGKSSDLSYLGATTEGNSENAQFAMNLSARPYEQLSIVAQVNFDMAASTEQTELDYAFAEWEASDKLRLRVGRVKHPLGIYGEVFDVGTVRPFQYLPQSIYGAVGFTAKAYNGVGLTGNTRHGEWEIQYDAYAGEIDGDYFLATPPSTTAVPPIDMNASPKRNVGFRYRTIVGGRVHVQTPVDGLMIGASGYMGKDDVAVGSVVREVDRTVIVGSGEFARGPLTLRTEWGRAESDTVHTTKSGYVEASYRITPKWQIAGRWEKLDADIPAFATFFVGPLKSILRHEDTAIGLNYWVNANLVLRADYHMVEGNRIAHPDTNRDYLTMLGQGFLQSETDAVVLGAQFSF